MADNLHQEIEEPAESLVREGVLEGRRAECCAKACAELTQAVTARSSDTAIWLNTCARLSAHDAASITLAVLEDTTWPEAIRLAAMDAARSVAHETPLATRTAERLIALADTTLESHPAVAARALMGAMILDEHRGIVWMNSRLTRWPVNYLSLPIERATMIIARVPPHERESHPEFQSLRPRVMRFGTDVLHRLGKDDEFTYVNVLDLLAVLAPFAPLPETIRIIVRAYEHESNVIRAGAATATRILLIEHTDAESLIQVHPNGERLVVSAKKIPIPRAYRTN